jgi:Tfp pilus assembly protein PilX
MSKFREYSRQSGATLVVTLIMLVLMTLFALSAINSSTINLRIAGNMQAQDEARAAAQTAIEQFISNYANFYPSRPSSATTYNIDINNDGSSDYAVSVAVPACRRAALQVPARSTSCESGTRAPLNCWDTLWDIQATASDTKTGVSQVVVQGVALTFGPDFQPSTVGCNN